MPTTSVSPKRACLLLNIGAFEVARFDVYAHPDASLRKKTPFLLDVQNDHLKRIGTRVVVPLRPASHFPLPMKDLNPTFEIAGKDVVLDTAALGAFPLSELKNPVTNLRLENGKIIGALDLLFGAY